MSATATETVAKHAVFATDHDGNRHRVSAWLSWGAAQDEWTRLDDLRRAGELQDVRFFGVRSSDDPGYNRAPRSPWLTQTAAQRPDCVKLDRTERQHVVELARGTAGMDEAADVVFTHLLGQARWSHLEATVVSDYAWGVARFAFPREARFN